MTEIRTVFDLTLPSIAANLALEEALLIAADEFAAGPCLRFWELAEPAVVLGATGRLHEDVAVPVCADDGVAVARRSSGGGTVVIGPGALNIALVLPSDAAPGLGAVDRAQHYVLERIARSLQAIGIAVNVLGHGDLVIGDRKCAGSAQRRLRNHFLVHATLLYAFELPLISRYTYTPRRQPAYRAGRSHADFVVNVNRSRPELIEAISTAWGVSLPVTGDCRKTAGDCPDFAQSSEQNGTVRLPESRFATVPVTEQGAVPEHLVRQLVETKFGRQEWVERL